MIYRPFRNTKALAMVKIIARKTYIFDQPVQPLKQKRNKKTPKPIETNDDNLYEVEAIRSWRVAENGVDVEYLVEWVGGKEKYGDEYRTWEPRCNIPNTLYEEVRKCCRNNDTYHDELVSTPTDCKKLANSIFTKAVQHIGTPIDECNILILDTDEFYTAKQLLLDAKVVKSGSQITIPNPFQYGRMFMSPEQKRHKFDIRPSFAGDVINTTDKTFHAIWLDYCCTFGGNNKVSPRDDIQSLFKRQLLNCNNNANTVLGLTFSCRNDVRTTHTTNIQSSCETLASTLYTEFQQDIDDHFNQTYQQKIYEFVNECAQQTNYQIKSCFVRSYGTIYFCLFEIVQQQ